MPDITAASKIGANQHTGAAFRQGAKRIHTHLHDMLQLRACQQRLAVRTQQGRSTIRPARVCVGCCPFVNMCACVGWSFCEHVFMCWVLSFCEHVCVCVCVCVCGVVLLCICVCQVFSM